MRESKYREEINSLIRELEEHDHFSVIEATLNNLATSETDQKKALMRMPWTQFLLLKLALMGNSGSKKITLSRFNHYANRLYSIQIHAAGLEADSIIRQLRPMLLQQLWYQKNADSTLLTIFRQSVLFCGKNPWYANEFRKISGLDLRNFYTITTFILLDLKNHKKSMLDINIFQLLHKLCPGIPYPEILNYFKLIGIRTADLPSYAAAHRLKDIYPSEYFQDTPFKNRPILINGEQLIIFEKNLFITSITELIPELLKKIQGYKDNFGHDFERYIDNIFTHSQIPFWREKPDLENFYKKHNIRGKIVDFLFQINNHTILIESKAIEPSPIAKTASDPELLKKILDDSFIKAIKQGVHSAYWISKTEKFNNNTFSLLIVTHLDFGIYGGRWISDHVDFEISTWIKETYPDVPLSLDDVIYCTIADLEDLLRGHVAGIYQFSDIIKKSSTKDIEPSQQLMTFAQVISQHLTAPAEHHTQLKEEMDKSLTTFSDLILKNPAFWGKNYSKLISVRNHCIGELNANKFTPRM
ncbi:hypothetical protein PII47_22180 [Pseudomonas sp. 21TX0197]|uniref:GapS1 family protein n=1 Tax=Pseudomonas sp. 21TX0197 TaxID=2972639 RepID=UPI00232C898C|nr:hypothetical protein [Pseudomonas sp. 21TX0197]MDB6446111.1 hypothetical protein [Pseudomonas sp. 21TX0197]